MSKHFKPISIYPGEVRRWNRTLADCYLRGCVCEGCPIKETYDGFICRCKGYVLEAVRKFGVPESLERESNIIGDEQ